MAFATVEDQFEERGNRLHVAIGDRDAGDLHRLREPGQLQFGVIRLVVDEAPGERLPHDLADPLGRDLLLPGDFVMGVPLAQAGEDAALAEDPAARVKPPHLPRRSRRLVAHIRLA